MPKLHFKQVDVFTEQAYRGNPVAVILDADALSARQMQSIANWTNLSETTFILKPETPEADYRLRIFTPKSELPFAGHPTLGSAHAFAEACGLRDSRVLVQQCARGLIPVRFEPARTPRLELRLPEARIQAFEDPRAVLMGALGVAPIEDPMLIDVGPRWLVTKFASSQQVRDLKPDFTLLAALSHTNRWTGVTVFGVTDGQTEVRSFAPADGIDEDPVCGSGNGAVAVYRWRAGERNAYVADQGSCVARAGRVYVRYEADGTVWLGGDAVTCISGQLSI